MGWSAPASSAPAPTGGSPPARWNRHALLVVLLRGTVAVLLLLRVGIPGPRIGGVPAVLPGAAAPATGNVHVHVDLLLLRIELRWVRHVLLVLVLCVRIKVRMGGHLLVGLHSHDVGVWGGNVHVYVYAAPSARMGVGSAPASSPSAAATRVVRHLLWHWWLLMLLLLLSTLYGLLLLLLLLLWWWCMLLLLLRWWLLLSSRSHLQRCGCGRLPRMPSSAGTSSGCHCCLLLLLLLLSSSSSSSSSL